MVMTHLNENAVLADPSTPGWLKSVIRETRGKDPVDVLAAVEVLLAICQQRHEICYRKLYR